MHCRDFPGKNTGVGCYALQQRIDLPDPWIEAVSFKFLHWQAGSLPLAPPEKPTISPDLSDLQGDFVTLVLKTDSKCMKDLNHSNCKVKLKDKEIFLY